MANNLELPEGRWPHLRDMVGSYFGDPSNDDPLDERIEAVKADTAQAYVDGVLADIADLLQLDEAAVAEIWEREMESYYWPGGDGLTASAWLGQVAGLLALPADTTRDHRSGLFGA